MINKSIKLRKIIYIIKKPIKSIINLKYNHKILNIMLIIYLILIFHKIPFSFMYYTEISIIIKGNGTQPIINYNNKK